MAKNRNTDDCNNKGRVWVDLLTKLGSPLIIGMLIAWAGYISESTLVSISSREESARLITELQVKREQSETDLRRSVFDQALKAFFKKSDEEGGLTEGDNKEEALKELSKQMLRLEMLSLNFGDTLSLSPLFNEFRRELQPLTRKSTNKATIVLRAKYLMKRLTSLATRVASKQFSSLVQHGGVSLNILITLPKLTIRNYEGWIYDKGDYVWPEDETNDINAEHEIDILEIDGKKRRIGLIINDINAKERSAKVNIAIWPVNKDGKPDRRPTSLEVKREFQLDFFNFPMVDNTRLEQSQRFSIIMENFEIGESGSEESSIEIAAIIFPAEYASVRDRPGMKEALGLLKSALNNSKDK